jgi:hypothetical protein
MNVFILDESPIRAAEYHCDKHIVKMPLEAAQLLCTAHRVLDGKEQSLVINGRQRKLFVHSDSSLDQTLYTSTHVNHGCAVWVRESAQNYYWLYELMLELNNEFVRRYRKEKDHETICRLSAVLSQAPSNQKDIGFTMPPLCMPDEYKIPGDVVRSYRNYYSKGKRSIATWTDTPIPHWF